MKAVLLGAVFVAAQIATATVSLAASDPFQCSIPVIDPARRAADKVNTSYSSEKPHTALSYLLLGGRFRKEFAASAQLTLPEVLGNRGFYSNWLLLIAFGGVSFVQLEMIRWERYGYRNEIGITWAKRNGVLAYRDTGVFLDNLPHRLMISAKNGAIRFFVDGRAVCAAPLATFFSASDHLFYQVGTEVSRPGDLVSGSVENVRVKFEGDAGLHPYDVRCVYRGSGVSWEPSGKGAFRAEGVYDPTAPYFLFEGVRHGTSCVY